MTKIAAMPIYNKNVKFFFCGTKRPMTLKVCMQHRVLEYYQVCSNDDPGLTLTYLRQGQILCLMLLYGKNKTMDSSETVVVYDIKVGRCSQLNKRMKLMSTKGQGHWLTLVQIAQIQYF